MEQAAQAASTASTGNLQLTGSDVVRPAVAANAGDGDREHLLSTAVKFLLNPRVRKTSIYQKLEFLRQKGLTEHEIMTACQRAGLDPALEQKQPGHAQSQSQALVPYMYPVVAASVWTKAKDVANLVALFSIGSFSLYYLWKQFLAPKLFGIRNAREETYEKLLISISKLNENVTELKNLIRSIQESQALQQQIETGSSKNKTSYELKEIKNELSAIKGLLLGRAQFPTSPSSGGIPSWQMLEAEGDETEESNNSKDSVKSKRKERKSQRKQDKDKSSTVPDDAAAKTRTEGVGMEADADLTHQFVDMAGSSSSTVNIVRRQQQASSCEGDSNNGFTSGSSCEVVFLREKNYSNSETSSE